jgi:hypothetical protein
LVSKRAGGNYGDYGYWNGNFVYRFHILHLLHYLGKKKFIYLARIENIEENYLYRDDMNGRANK